MTTAADNLHARFAALCERNSPPRQLRRDVDVVGGFLALIENGSTPSRELEADAKQAAARIEAWYWTHQ